ncbi:MAG: hypothetical protein WDZ45_13390 [Flavobacteriaceae bacterium]
MKHKLTKNLFIKSLIAGFILLIINFIGLFINIKFFPSLADEYFSPAFDMEGYKGVLFLLHPFIVSFALAWFWKRFKKLLSGNFWMKGIEVGLVYGLIAVFPSMWMILSAFDVSLVLVISWFIHGLIQGTIVGLIYAKMDS